jgi:polysaccharide biosynthesis transport protein
MKNFGLSWRRLWGEDSSDGAIEIWSESPVSVAPIVTLSSFWLFLRRNARRIALSSALAASALFVVFLLVFNKYSAVATIMVEPRVANITQDADVVQNIGADAIAVESLVQSYRTDAFLGALADRLGLVKDGEFGDRDKAIKELAKELDISRRGATYVIDVTARNRSAEKSARIANAAAAAIIDSQREIRSRANDKVAGDIAARLDEVSGRVTNAEQAVAERKAKLKVTDVGQGTTLLERRAYDLGQQLALASARTAEAKARFEQLRRAGDGSALSPALQSNLLASLRADYARLAGQAADQTAILGARHPAVIAMNAHVAALKRQIGAELARLAAAAQSDFATARQSEDALGSQLKATQDEAAELGPQLVRLDQLQREAKAEQLIYQQLLDRQKQLVATRNLSPDDIRLVSPATPPNRIKPGLAARAAAAAVLGLLAGLAFALARETVPGVLTTARQAERLDGVKVVGMAPLLPQPDQDPSSNPSSKPAAGPDLTPWLDELCALSAQGAEGRARVLLISSPCRGAGRSTVARACAAFLADGGARVLLIRADRAPDTGRRPRFGLIDVLDRGADLQRAFVENASAGYTVLPFGGREPEGRPSTSALMSGVTLRALMHLCRQWFDVVVIDGPPALEAGYGPLLARQADMTVLVAEWRKTVSSEIAEAIDRLGVEDAALFFNKVDIALLRRFDPAESRRIEVQAESYRLAS